MHCSAFPRWTFSLEPLSARVKWIINAVLFFSDFRSKWFFNRKRSDWFNVWVSKWCQYLVEGWKLGDDCVSDLHCITALARQQAELWAMPTLARFITQSKQTERTIETENGVTNSLHHLIWSLFVLPAVNRVQPTIIYPPHSTSALPTGSLPSSVIVDHRQNWPPPVMHVHSQMTNSVQTPIFDSYAVKNGDISPLSPSVDMSDFDILKVLGTGAYGKVRFNID